MKTVRPESDIELSLTRAIEAKGWVIRKASWVGRRGAADRIIFAAEGVTALAEVKRPERDLDPLQKVERAAIAPLGHQVTLIRSEGDVAAFVTLVMATVARQRYWCALEREHG